jgi:hypothetical protein
MAFSTCSRSAKSASGKNVSGFPAQKREQTKR